MLAFIRRLTALAAFAWALVLAPLAYAATLLPPGEQTFFDDNGDPLSLGKVYFYIPSTLTPKDTWQDAGQSILNTNPVTLDAAGRAIIYGSGTYRQIVKDANGSTVWDQLTADTSAGGAVWAGTSAGTANAQTLASSGFTGTDGQIVNFLVGPGLTNTAALTLTFPGNSPIPVLKDLTTGPASLTGSEVVAGNAVSVLYDISLGAFHILNFNAATLASLNLTGQFSLAGAITPSVIAANTNNWNPSGLQTASVIRMSASAAYNITGLTAPTTYGNGRVIVLRNVGTFNITLTDNDSGSTAANRFNLGRPIVVAPSQSIALLYDSTLLLWVPAQTIPAQPVAGGYKNLVVTGTGDTTATITADEIALEDTNGVIYRARSVSVTCTITTSGANGLDTGAEASNTWYSMWVIFAPTTATTACLMSASATAPTMPATYTYKARTGWVRNNSGSNLYRTIQYGNRATYIVGTNPTALLVMANGNTGGIGTFAAIATGAYVPSTASGIIISASTANTTQDIAVAPNASYGSASSATNPPPLSSSVDTTMQVPYEMQLESSNIYYATTNSGPAVLAVGWRDNL